jgi:hypothetical protein
MELGGNAFVFRSTTHGEDKEGSLFNQASHSRNIWQNRGTPPRILNLGTGQRFAKNAFPW